MTSNKRTEALPRERFTIGGSSITVQPYILPHLSNIKPEEVRTPGGREGLRQSQGFYVYRNRRLIVSGTWFRLIRLDELTKLARVRIDIPNSLDKLWRLDVKKSTASPPENVRVVLRRIIDRIAERSSNVFRDRKRRSRTGEVTHVWERLRVRGGIAYAINRDHPQLTAIRDALRKGDELQLRAVLKMLELSLPVDAIYADMAADLSVEPPVAELQAELKELARTWIERAGNARARSKLIGAMPLLEPFSMYPGVTRRILEDLKSSG